MFVFILAFDMISNFVLFKSQINTFFDFKIKIEFRNQFHLDLNLL